MTDDELLRRFEDTSLDSFRHADHVRVAHLYLARHGPEQALVRMLDGVRRFADAKGATGKFHYTMTRAWLRLVSDARALHPDAVSADALIAACPLLADARALDRFYSAPLLQSDRSRSGWVEPDIEPLAVTLPLMPHTDTLMPNPDPFVQFEAAVANARHLGVDTTPVALGTADAQGRPSVRMVLLRGADSRGFVFHTNYASRKGRDLSDNPNAALCLHWPTLEEQIRIEGPVVRLPQEESDAYFAGRPRGSQIGAWASRQSQILPAREVLERRVAELEQQFDGQPIPRPAFWGGFRLQPRYIEFWYGRTSRLHDRVVYTRDENSWRIERLFP
jgi:pyridoxamine 5'-phosphate oxidase